MGAKWILGAYVGISSGLCAGRKATYVAINSDTRL